MGARLSLSLTLSLLFHIFVTPPLGAQPEGEQYIEVSKNTLLLSCYAPDNTEGSRFAQTDILVSPDGRYRAYAESHALFTVAAGKATDRFGAGCVNNSKLYVSRTESSRFEEVVALEPKDEEGTGNGIWPADWSPDSRYLLILWQRFFYESEYDSHRLMILDAESKQVSTPDFDDLLRQHMGRECSVFSVPQGFTEDGQVAVAAYADDYNVENSCVQQQTLWLLDPRKLIVQPVPNEFEIKRYGRWEGHSTNN